MAALSHSESNKKYSWWWDSHISPKNSKWLQENLTDMDVKVKQMIKLIELDADSFARRAEMYYKKRPELMKLVEEFYRAYRALAERYDHATGVIRQAHRTMAEAFPNQVPPVPADDLHANNPSMENEPHTPDATRHSHAFADSDELPKDPSTHETDTAISRKGLKQLNNLFMTGESISHVNFAEGRARRGLNFFDTEETNGLNNGSHDTENQVLSDSERMTKTETEILELKMALAKLESEKEDGLIQYQKSLGRLSNLESEMSRARENSQGLDDRASKAEAEVQTLKESLSELQAERESNLLQYQQCLEKICNLEKNISSAQKDLGELNERATRAETEAESLKADLERLDGQKEAALFQYNQSLETLSKLEEKLVQAEENARRTNEQAGIAKNEIDDMKLEIGKLTKEKEDEALHYQQCLEIISSLEHKLSCAQEEVRELNCKLNDGAEKIHISEEKCLLLETLNQTLQSELQSLAHKIGSQSEELCEKQKELGRLWTSIQEERLRFIEAETAFQTLQNLHSQSQDELRSLAAELHNKAEILETMESHKQSLEDEVHKAKEENKILNDIKLSSSLSMNNLQDEIFSLRETVKLLEMEVGLRVDERNALQQEIYCLKEELNDVNKRHVSTVEEIRSTGLDLQCFSLSVKTLQDENSKLKETCEAGKGENAALNKKLEIMENLLEKNANLESSLSVLNAELESVRGRVKVLEETCESLLEEKSTLAAEKAALFFQLQTTSEKLEKLSEKNHLLENSLFDVNAELEGLRVKSKILEETCLSLDHEKSSLTSEKETLDLQLNMTRLTLKNLEKQHSDLELQHLELKAERESALQKVEDLLVSLYAEREERSRTVQLNEGHLVEKEFQIQILQEDANYQKKEYEEELDRAVHAQMETFILQKCIRDLEQRNFSLLVESKRLFEVSKMSDRLISKLEADNVQKQVDTNLLSEKINVLRTGLLQVLKSLDINSNHLSEDNVEEEELLNHIHDKLQETQNSFVTVFHENQQAAIENSVLVSFLGQLKLKVENLFTEREALDGALRTKSKQYLSLQEEVRVMIEKNQELKLTIDKVEEQMEVMTTEKLTALKELSKELDKLVSVNTDLEERLKIVMGKLEDVQRENSYLKESFVVSNTELKLVESVNDKLNCQIRNGEELLSQKENEILGAAEMYSALQDEKKALQKSVEDLKSKYDEATVILEDQDSQILKLSSDKDCQNDELGFLCEVNKKLEAEMGHLHQELGETKLREKKLSYALLKRADAIEQWESQAATHYTGMLISTVNETFFEGKVRELADACENLEYRSSSEAMESEKLKERVNKLEGENRRLQGQLAAYVPAVSGLNDCITSLEMQTLVHAKPHHDYKESKIKRLANIKYAEGDPRKSVDQNATETDALPDFHDMQKRVNVIEMAVKQMNESFKPKDEMREIQVLKSGTGWRQGNILASKHSTQMDEVKEHQFGAVYGQKTGKSLQDIPVAEIEVLQKDIMLDHMDGTSRRGAHESDDQMLELWETADKDGTIGVTVGKGQKDTAPTGYYQRRPSKESKNRSPSVESLIEKELSVDKLEISRLQEQPLLLEGNNKRKVLERLDSDAQKLMNLEITVQDLINKMEIIEKSTMGKGMEYDAAKGQLESAQEAITKLFDANRKLMKNVEEGTSSFAGKSTTVPDESASVSRRRVSEQARRGSEKIGRLQLEVQRLQFLLLKLNDDKEGKGKGKATIDDQNPRVLLRDYLYGGTRKSYHKLKKKKASFCACVQPPTKGD